MSDTADPVPVTTTPTAGERAASPAGEAIPPQAVPSPIARVLGQPYHELPQDLFIPPDALEVFLDAFEGPLDLLLYLIRRQQLDILNLPILQITSQYMEYVELMQGLNLELAAEYLLMAAWLAEIKSRLLLPKAPELEDEEEGEDPRVTLIRRLQEYERYKVGAERVNELPRLEREIFIATALPPDFGDLKPLTPDVSLVELALYMQSVVKRATHFEHHQIRREQIPTRVRMAEILAMLSLGQTLRLDRVLRAEEGRMGVLVTFLALLELCKEQLIWILQAEPLGPIHFALAGQHEESERGAAH
ncbi:TPA: segregation/condensation protein A [Aeromonas hydrophila]|uniref:segregation and condensation protein A n=1 Tax=Aeromonas hydrophila TaxID=644 RepID=UPI00227AC264|nr:ScpA family protein [Aeromonas hydrophila]WAF92000.1 segregation/condensation protein A [Aeromonas hydrophila]WAG04726.1 segregation/condensation protein A [Aeromonas hydrophila]HEA3130006.1 segregation/condensation protein A [Aeromonas hydrophila]